MPKPKETISRSEQETMQLASRLASRAKPGDLYLLRGNLGAGKSVFARAFIRDLMKDKDLEVPSPTYTLAQTYESGHGTIWHFDLYRLKEPEEIFEIGWEEALSGGITLVEWPQRAEDLIPADHHEITFSIRDDGSRIIHHTEHGTP